MINTTQYITVTRIKKKYIQKVWDALMRRIEREINEQLPQPTCPLKKEKREWKVEQIKAEIGQRLGGFGIKVTVDIDDKS